MLRTMNEALDTYLDLRSVPITGAPILTAADKFYLTASGEAIAGRYTLTFSGTTATQTTVTVTYGSIHHYRYGDTFLVERDDTTEYDYIIPGVVLVFSSSVSFSNLWSIDVIVYEDFLGSIAAGNPTGVPPGVAIFEERRMAKNVGTTDVTGAYAVLYPFVKPARKSAVDDPLFVYFRAVGLGAVEKYNPLNHQTEPYEFTAGGMVAGSPKTINLFLDGLAFNVRDMQEGDVIPSTSLIADGSRIYRIEEAPLANTEFVIPASVLNSTAENVLVFPVQHIRIAEDIASAPGTYGTDPVQLVVPGGGPYPPGTIPAGLAAPYWIQVDVEEAATGNSNPYPMEVTYEYHETGAALWGVP